MGDTRESLGGPFIYIMVLLFSTLLFWRDLPVGVVSFTIMACGDGLTNLVGRRLGSTNNDSSIRVNPRRRLRCSLPDPLLHCLV